MSAETSTPCCSRTSAWVLGSLGTLGLMLVLVWAMVRATRPEDITAIRARERAVFLQEIRQADAQALTGYAWVDQGKGIVRLPVTRARELVLREWQNPTAARSNLIARVEKATEIPPPPANIYE